MHTRSFGAQNTMPGHGKGHEGGGGSGGARAGRAEGRCALDAQLEAWERWHRLVVRTLRLLELEFLAGMGGGLVKYWGLRARDNLQNLRMRARIQKHLPPSSLPCP